MDLGQRIAGWATAWPETRPPADLAIHVMHELLNGVRHRGAIPLLCDYSSPLPLLQVQKETDLVTDETWEKWAHSNVNTFADAVEFLRYASEEPELERTPVFHKAILLLVHES